jgi:Flp pilus assembly protein TadD
VPDEVRGIARRVLERARLRDVESEDYATCFELAKQCLTRHNAQGAIQHLKKAISLAPERPEAFNLLGAIHELHGEFPEARNNYCVAWNFDATYEPARKNLERVTGIHPSSQGIDLGDCERKASSDV